MNVWRKCAVVVCALAAWAASAQTIGNQTSRGTGTSPILSNNPAQAYTLIDFSHPAVAAGRVTTVTFRWSDGSSCTGAAKIKILRRSSQALNTFTIIERGPFNTLGTVNTVALDPPIDILPGDYIGIAQLRGSSRGPCGGAALAVSTPDQVLLGAEGDLQAGSFSALRPLHGYEMSVIASATPEVLAAVVPVAGAAPGSNNSFFRTALQLANIQGATISGRIVFHPAGQSASASDPSMPYTLGGYQTKSFNDIVAALGRTGVGSIDIYTTSSIPAVVNARVYNDLGTAGTSGLTQNAFPPSEALRKREHATLHTPLDLNRFRLNVGVRTLSEGATIVVTTLDSSDGALVSVVKSYPPNYFIQVSAADFAGRQVSAGSFIALEILEGSAFIYGATTDNKTNDPSVQFALRK